jgi:acyl carrier protein
MTTLQRLQSLISQRFAQASTPVDADTTLESLGIDSLGVIELMFELEEAFDVKLDPDEAAALATVGEVAAHIDALWARRGGAVPINGTDVVRAA